MKKKQELIIDASNINEFTTADREKVFEHARRKIHGFPSIWPIKSPLGKRVILSFVDASIYDLKGNLVEDGKVNFDILEEDRFNSEDPLAITKIKFIDALLTPSLRVRGGVYYKGKYYTSKMNKNKALFLLKSFLNTYFHLEDGELIDKYFEVGVDSHLPFWPTKSRDGKKVAIFSAVNATIKSKLNPEADPIGPITFTIYQGDILSPHNKEDAQKINYIFSLLSKDRLVEGFYYKGKLLPNTLTDEFKLYLEKSFIKKNFLIEDHEFLLTNASLDKKTGYPFYWPMMDKKGRGIAISVVNAAGDLVSDESFANFNVYTDEKFDLRKKEFQTKLEIIKALFYGGSLTSGALYLDGLLIPGNESESECVRRKEKVERALKIYISNSPDFAEISKHFSTDDREQLMNISDAYNDYYPGNKVVVSKKDSHYDKNGDEIVHIIDANVLNEKGVYILKEAISSSIKVGEKVSDKNIIEIFKGVLNPNLKVRGAVYYKGRNVAQKKHLKEFEDYLRSALSESDLNEVLVQKETSYYQYTLDKRSGMTKFWPTRDQADREVLLSVVDADVRFKNGRTIVKAVSNATFDIYEGETFGLVGESGSGKTTISRAILGINKLAKGAIYYKGKLISSGLPKREAIANKKNIQMIFQDPAASLNERANVDYIVSEGLYNFNLFKTKEERIEKVVNMLSQVGLLPEHLSRYPHEFSGGQRQRIGIARALVIEPQLVLADEPISALDVSIRAQVLNLLKKLQKEQGLTYLFIAHDLSIIRYISDRIAVMHNGFIVELGPADEIYSHPLHPYTKSLLTAIPQPDPKTKNERKKIRYEQGSLRYEDCYWEEFRNGHFVLVNNELRDKIKEEVKKIK